MIKKRDAGGVVPRGVIQKAGYIGGVEVWGLLFFLLNKPKGKTTENKMVEKMELSGGGDAES